MLSYESTKTIAQANAMGQRLVLELHEDEAPFDHPVFVKRVVVSDYIETKKDWADLRRTLLYMRTEVRFYQETLPLLKESTGFSATPKIYLAQHDLHDKGWLPEEESGVEPSAGDPPAMYEQFQVDRSLENIQGSGVIIMDCVHDDVYMQASPISIDQAKQCLTAVAQLHAAAWENVHLLEHCAQRLSLGSYHLKVRNPKELAGMHTSWEHFASQFAGPLQEAGLRDRTKNLGTRLQKAAKAISQQLSPAFNDPYATLAHGDFKSMNVFLPKEPASSSSPPLMVDYASTGVGLGMSDVAMHIHHAVTPENLANGGEEALVDHYLSELETLLPSGKSYPRDVALQHYRMAVCDYCRFVLGRFWKTATPAAFEKSKNSPNTTLINRNVKAAMAYLDRVERYLTEFEQRQQQDGKGEL